MGFLEMEAEEMARGGQEIMELQLSWPGIFRRNHGFPTRWAKGVRRQRNGNNQQTTWGQVIQSKDMGVLAGFPTSCLLQKAQGCQQEEAGGVSSASSL